MNPIAIANQLTPLPEGVSVENRRQRITVILALAAAIVVPLPGSIIAPGAIRTYFVDSSVSLRDRLFEINESMPFDVEQAIEFGSRLFERRVMLAYYPTARDLLSTTPFVGTLAEMIPQLESLQISDADVRGARQLLTDSEV